MRSIPMIVLGVVFILGGALLAGMTYQKPNASASTAPVKKSELRAQEAEKKNAVKQRIGGAILALFGVLVILVIA
jgi:hypothetical protein